MFQLWHKYIELIIYFPNQANFIFKNEFYTKYKEELAKYMKKSIINVSETINLLLPVEHNIGEVNKNASIELRNALNESYNKPAVNFVNKF